MRSLVGLWGLALAVLGTRGQVRGRYWRWRRETAAGPGAGPGAARRRRMALEYGRWVVQMRRLGRW